MTSSELRAEANEHFRKSQVPGLSPALRESHLDQARSRYAAAVAAADAAAHDAADARDAAGRKAALDDLSHAEKNLGVAHLREADYGDSMDAKLSHLRLAASHLLKAALARTQMHAPPPPAEGAPPTAPNAEADTSDDQWMQAIGERLREVVTLFVGATAELKHPARSDAMRAFMASLPNSTLPPREHGIVFAPFYNTLLATVQQQPAAG